MKIPIYQIDAFASNVFAGNPAAVCPLDAWLDDRLMQDIAAENNLSETAFFVPQGDDFRLRWFTPTAEVDLCGHATLASAFVLYTQRGYKRDSIVFHTQSGPLTVRRERDLLALDFPSRPPRKVKAPAALAKALGAKPNTVLAARDYLCVFEDERQVRNLALDFTALGKLDRKVIVTARGKDCDFVSRFFAPTVGVNEDPVTGSSHCTLIPYWAQELGKTKLRALQVSKRGGELFCELRKDRVKIAGRAALFLQGTITV